LVPCFPENPGLKKSGFTLTELVIVMAIMGLLATLLFPALSSMRARAEKAVCIGNIRSIYVSLSAYLTDNGHWPQIPEDVLKAQPDQQRDIGAKFWVDTLKPYGATEKVWTCPTLGRKYEEDPSKFSEYPRIHYVPSEFDEKPMTPRSAAAMPWVIEIGSLHGGGNLLIRADGGVRELDDLLRELGVPGGPISVHQIQ